jgi:tRNA-Thr(GGU) m(6)t(6)A37 methyltransferase TsaA
MQHKQQTFNIVVIGQVKRENGRVYLSIDAAYRPGLKQLEHFGYVQVLWWFNHAQDERARQVLESRPPYGEGTPMTGVFASRWPERPNPIALTTAKVLRVDHAEGTVELADMDAFDDTPIIDLKPYLPICDRVKAAKVPEWIAHWPEWMPENGMGLAEGEQRKEMRRN